MSRYEDDDLDPLDDLDDREGEPRRRRRLKDSRGSTVLVLGILGLVVCVVCGIVAWVMGSSDLKEMRAGRMERRGESETRVGMVLGIVSTCLGILGLVFAVLVIGGIFTITSAVAHDPERFGFDVPRVDGREARATRDLDRLALAIDGYRLQKKALPTSLESLTERIDGVPPALDRVPIDPWGSPYAYVRRGPASYGLSSSGPDRIAGTDDDVVHVSLER